MTTPTTWFACLSLEVRSCNRSGHQFPRSPTSELRRRTMNIGPLLPRHGSYEGFGSPRVPLRLVCRGRDNGKTSIGKASKVGLPTGHSLCEASGLPHQPGLFSLTYRASIFHPSRPPPRSLLAHCRPPSPASATIVVRRHDPSRPSPFLRHQDHPPHQGLLRPHRRLGPASSIRALPASELPMPTSESSLRPQPLASSREAITSSSHQGHPSV